MYTALNDPIIEQSLQKQLDIIVKHTVELYGRDCTVILAGGFGRGEGSIRLNKNKTAIPLHDFDTYVITNLTVNSARHEAMEKALMGELSKVTDTDLQEENFVLGVEVVPRRSLKRLPPDLSTYEMKASSTVLYGKDVRAEIPVTKQDIALGSAAITLFHRTTALLKNVEPEFLTSREYPRQRRLETVYECCKVYTEIGTALSLLGGFYQPSYQARATEFAKNFSLFPELEQTMPDLPPKVLAHTRMKLLSNFSPMIDNPFESWVGARRSLDGVLRFFLSKFLRINIEANWKQLCQRSRGRMRSLFFQDYLAFYLARLGVRGSPLVSAANLAFQAYDYQSFRMKMKRNGACSAMAPISITSPILDVYLASALVLFALQDEGDIDRITLDAGRDFLNRIFCENERGSRLQDVWKRARGLCVEGQRLYFVAKQQKTVL